MRAGSTAEGREESRGSFEVGLASSSPSSPTARALQGKSQCSFCNHRKPTIPAYTLYSVFFSAAPDWDGAMSGGGVVVVPAATAAQVISGEVASITGTLAGRVTAYKCCSGGTDDSKVQGRKCLAQGHTASSAGWDQSASRAGQCWAALLGVVCRSGRPGNRQCPGTEGGEPRSMLWLALGRSGLGTVPSTPPKLTPLLKH